jgi:transposase
VVARGRHGTVDLLAALNVATGEVLTQTRSKHTGDDVLAFFKWIDLHTPKHHDVHVVLDNLSAHKSEPVRTWLAHPKRARWHLHFTPTSASWVNLIENWFSLLTKKRLINSAFTSVADLVAAIEEWTSHWNGDPRPFVWTKPATDIIAKVRRGRATLAHQINSAADQ